jgi:hypothetical protein
MNDSANDVFRPIASKIDIDLDQFTLGNLVEQRRWVAWRTERRTNKDASSHVTKVPYRVPTQRAKADEPSTWATLDAAAATAEKIDGGVGICLGIEDCFPGLMLGGVDLDTCIDDSGVVAPWAVKLIERFASLTEVSPSGKGAKIFFLYRASAWENQIKPLLRGAKTGRQFKRPADHDHPPGLEIYFRARFFAVTADIREGFPDRLRIVDPEDLRWVVEQFGPRFCGKADAHTALPLSSQRSAATSPRSDGGRDNSRSGRAYRWMRIFHLMGLYYQEAKARILDLEEDPDVADWAATKGMLNNERELRRVYEAARPFPGSLDDRFVDLARTVAAERDS